MLVAYGPNNQPIIASEITLEQLQRWSRERMLHCPNCRGIVHIRGGAEKQVQLHFAHQHGECAWSTETESVRHMRGKSLLAEWVRKQYPQAVITLEKRLPEPNRIADIFVTHTDGRRWAIEFQCAPLDYAEWRHRHEAYRKARIRDIWIIGDNRREKHEAFSEAILTTTRELMFLDPLATPPRIWLRWLVSSGIIQQRQQWQHHQHLTFEQRGIHGEYRVTLTSTLGEVRLNAQERIMHATREAVEQQTQLLQAMLQAAQVDETLLVSYLRPHTGDEAIRVVLIPLLRAYIRDPDLLRRYNYGRGLPDEPVSNDDSIRVQKAQQWLERLRANGYTKDWWQTLSELIPLVGPYSAFARYIDMLLGLP